MEISIKKSICKAMLGESSSDNSTKHTHLAHELSTLDELQSKDE